MKRRTWRDRRRKSVGVTLDCITDSGMRFITTNDPFHAEGSKPTRVACMAVRTLALLYGIKEIERACAAGIREARRRDSKPKTGDVS